MRRKQFADLKIRIRMMGVIILGAIKGAFISNSRAGEERRESILADKKGICNLLLYREISDAEATSPTDDSGNEGRGVEGFAVRFNECTCLRCGRQFLHFSTKVASFLF